MRKNPIPMTKSSSNTRGNIYMIINKREKICMIINKHEKISMIINKCEKGYCANSQQALKERQLFLKKLMKGQSDHKERK